MRIYVLLFFYLPFLSLLLSSYRIFLLYVLVPAVLFIFLLRISFASTAFPVVTLVGAIYLLNTLFVLFWRGLSQINKLISPLSFFSLCLPLFDLYLTFLYPPPLSLFVWSFLGFGGPWESAVENARLHSQTNYYANVITNRQQ